MSSSAVETWSEMPLLSETVAESDVFVFPVSFAQQRLWFLEQLDSTSGQYNMATAVQIQGAIQTTVLQRSLQYLIDRHESLRTTFRTVAGDLMQVVHPGGSTTLTVVDGTSLSTQWQQWLVQAAQRPFDLTQTPLWRVTLLQLTPTEHILLLVMHHIISDGWSLNILVQELATVYAAIASGHPPVLPDLPIQYADFAIWQRDWLAQGERERQLNYWQQQLQGLSPLQLATDFSRPAIATGDGTRQTYTLSVDLTRGLRQLTQQSQTTLYMTVLTAWQTLLYRYSGQDDIAVGSPIANRNQAETQGLIGCFMNTLVIRSCIQEGITFRQLLAQVKHTVLAAYEHQDLPFETLVEALQPERDLSRNPLFQVWFALTHAATETLEIPGLTWNAINLERSTTQFDLSLEMVDQGQTLTATIEYSTDLFQSETIARLWNHFQVLLAGILENPDTELVHLPLLTPTEQQQVLWNWNQTQVEFPQHLCIHELFEQQARLTPEANAIVDSTQQLTYAELNHRANQLAHYLKQRGVRSETLVGLCLDRSVNLLVGILGILKAGGAYVPLDPAYPRDRLTFMLEDTQLSVLVTQVGLTAVPIPDTVQVIELDRQWLEISQQPDSNLSDHAQLDHLAYLIYTSGSTGRAKGVMIEHRSLVNAYFAWETAYELRSEIRCHLQMASFSFDVFTGDWVRALCSGGKLVLCPREILIDPPQLYAFIQQHQIDAAEFVPAVLRPLAQYVRDHQQRLDNFKLLVCGSDTWTWQDYQQIRQLCAPTTRLINSFGVTEATIDSSYFEAQTDGNDTIANLPIGRPFANTQLYILDRYQQPVPIGVPGELYIGGAGLARGYWQRPELTAERFIRFEFSILSSQLQGFSNSKLKTQNSKLYKTGDVARFQADGTIEFWGRADHQVKLRGYRIELGEIETVLSRHPQVQAAIVTLHNDDTGHKRLVAYVVPQSFTENCDSWLKDHLPSLQHHLKAQLPEYMMPAAFVALAQLPLTPNGKVDRRSLPSPHYSASETTALQTPIEQTLGKIWSEVLGLEQVGIHDNFFALGGDSILSIQIIAKANQAGLHLTPKHLFQHQTIAELATVAGKTATIQAEQGQVTGIVPLTPIQQWFFKQSWQAPHHWNQSVLLDVRQPLNLTWLKQSVQRIVEHHDMLRSRFWQTEQGWQQEIAEAVSDICPIEIDLMALPVDIQISALNDRATELQASLDLHQGVLLRIALFHLIIDGKPAQRLLIVIHHLVVDAVSWRILLEDLQVAYQQLSQGQKIQLPAKTISFQQWAEQLQEYAQTEELQQQQAYWRQGRSQLTALPLDYTTGANTVATTKLLSVSLTPEETQILLQELPQCYHTQINDVLLTALVHTFANWTGESTLWVDLEGHGREPLFSEVDTSRTVGWFTSVFPVCLEATETIQATIKRVKANLRQIPQNGIGYGLLRYLANTLLKSSIQPEVSFNYFGQLDTTTATSLFTLASESDGMTRSELDLRTYLLEINSSIVGGRFQVDWSYSTARHSEETIACLAEEFLSVLRSLIQTRTTATPCYTPSDFPLAKLDQGMLDQVIVRSLSVQQQAQNIESIYPLSPIQQGLLFHWLYHPESEAYFTQTWGTLVGSLNVAAFRQAWQQVVDQHAILRTAFVWDQLDAPLQVVYRQVTLLFEQQDWRHLSIHEQEQQWQVWLEHDRQRGCNPSQAPLMRITLIQWADDRYQFVWSHHHLLLDGWSTPLLLRDVLLSYEAYCQNRVPQLSSSPGYSHYIAWLEGRSLDQAERFWRHTLQGFVQPTPLPGTGTSLRSQDEVYAEWEVKLDVTKTTALQTFTRQYQITLNTLMQGCWALLLAHGSNQSDVVFGATVSGRPTDLPGADTMIGLFINTLPVRVQIRSNLSLLDWLQTLQAQQVEARQYEYTPLAQIQRWSQVPQGMPLFNSVLVFENYPVGADIQPDLQGVQIQAVQSAIRNHYPLTLRVAPQDELSLLWMYDSNQLSTETVQHRAKQLMNLLETISKQPQTSIQELLQILQDSDRQAQTAKAQTLDQVSRSSFQRTRRKATQI